ncbi:hypothetical protein TA3x_001605 [Tundrisphaera sp. TA3]|uniref:hypothetical protein n=1 Tax=Tundrisphaera sp. TA3 TaxID=3435775 RepID=UPI003EB7AEF3
MSLQRDASDPHGGTIRASGRTETSALILLHGRGASAEDIPGPGHERRIDGLGLLAPQAAGGTWYPSSFLAPFADNQPHLDSALAGIKTIVASLIACGLGAGVVHHVASRTPDAQQKAWRSQIAGRGLDVSPVMDRNDFHSIYFREPGGVLFEVATAPPGFSSDESPGQMGARLMLPAELEARRSELEQVPPRLRLPT